MTGAFQTKRETAKIERTGRVRVLDLFVNVCDYEAAIKEIYALTQTKESSYVCLSNVHMAMEAYKNETFADVVNNADLVLADGKPIVWMQRFLGRKDAEQIRGNTLMVKILKFAEENSLKIGFYGGREDVIEEIQKRCRTDFPDLEVVYAHSPPFRHLPEEDKVMTAEINKLQVSILFVALGCPKQEKWMAEHKDKINAVMLGVGAAFDFYAGNISEAPDWVRKIGLEWLFRLIQEPRRLWRRYILLNPHFTWLAILQLLGVRKFDQTTNAEAGN